MTDPTPEWETGVRDGPLPRDLCDPGRLALPEHGALASFLGVVRNHHFNRPVTHLVYDCYRPMAEKVLTALAREARERFDPACRVVVWHGVGEMFPGDVSVVIHVGAAHREAAFAACRYLIERIKEDLPIWKQEYYADGTSAWLKGS